jgi:uncharacterized membrane protein (UPF0127 family)
MLGTILAAAILAGAAGTARGDFCGYTTDGHLAVWRDQQQVARFRIARVDTPEGRTQGLMHCPRLPAGEGLLFVYPQDGPRSFWMKDTPVELGLVFIGDDLRIVSVRHGRPFALDAIPSGEPARLVLEVNALESQGLAPGDRVRLEP